MKTKSVLLNEAIPPAESLQSTKEVALVGKASAPSVASGNASLEAQTWNYTRSELVSGIKAVGVGLGDTVYLQVCIDSMGEMQGCSTPRQISEVLLQVLQEIVGPEGTILVPTYTFSFCRREVFDPKESPTVQGPWFSFADFAEYFRKLPGVYRSMDPIFSVAGIGPKTREILCDLPNTCLGADCVHDRLKKTGGKILMIGVGLFEATFRHHVEEMARVPWRYKKLFTGYVRDERGALRKDGRVYNVRILAKNGDPAGEALEAEARRLGACKFARVGLNEVVSINAAEYYQIAMREMERDPWNTARGPAADPVSLEDARVGGPVFEVKLSQNSSMPEMLESLWWLPRDIISDGYDAALNALGSQIPMTIHEYPSGMDCWSWIVPEKWTCHEAFLETINGRRLFSHSENPLHVVSYSLPFEGVVSRKELFKHLHTHPRLDDAVPFIFKYYEREWGLCCSSELKRSLTDEFYRVRIKTDFSYGTLKVGEVVAKGQSAKGFVLCSHLCHPHQANDDLTGVLVGLKVMSELLKRNDLRYTYRFLIVPETIGSIAYLSDNPDLVPNMTGGLFLEMLGLPNPHALQLSFSGDTQVDRCLKLALQEHDRYGFTGAFRTLIGNDERHFNAPGLRIPMLSLSRVLHPSAPDWPYKEYHSSKDTPESVSIASLEDSVGLVIKMIDTIENNIIPVNKLTAEPFCSRYGLHIDWYSNKEGNEAFFEIVYLIDGTRTIADIAEACKVPFAAVWDVVRQLHKHGLVEYRPAIAEA